MGKTVKPVSCPTCGGQAIFNSLIRSQVCETCGGSGKVLPGLMCFYCGRSVQKNYKGVLICGGGLCQSEVDKKLTDHSSLMNDDEYNKAWSMFE